jgi:hypothetical protein
MAETGVPLQFDHFAYSVREGLEILDVEPAFQRTDDAVRFMWPPYLAEVQAIDDKHARLSLSAHGELLRTIELPMTQDAAWLAVNGIAAVFEADLPAV